MIPSRRLPPAGRGPFGSERDAPGTVVFHVEHGCRLPSAWHCAASVLRRTDAHDIPERDRQRPDQARPHVLGRCTEWSPISRRPPSRTARRGHGTGSAGGTSTVPIANDAPTALPLRMNRPRSEPSRTSGRACSGRALTESRCRPPSVRTLAQQLAVGDVPRWKTTTAWPSGERRTMPSCSSRPASHRSPCGGSLMMM